MIIYGADVEVRTTVIRSFEWARIFRRARGAVVGRLYVTVIHVCASYKWNDVKISTGVETSGLTYGIAAMAASKLHVYVR